MLVLLLVGHLPRAVEIENWTPESGEPQKAQNKGKPFPTKDSVSVMLVPLLLLRLENLQSGFCVIISTYKYHSYMIFSTCTHRSFESLVKILLLLLLLLLP